MASVPIRVYADGCFDMVHFGHANALRQAKAMGDQLVVGVHSDEEITHHKGPPVFKEQERYEMVRNIKWVDEVVEGAPYVATIQVLDGSNCDFCVHGDDVSVSADGTDVYSTVKASGRYKECKRTEGVSTTDLVGRMLLATRTHLNSKLTPQDQQLLEQGAAVPSVFTQNLMTSFSAEIHPPKPTDRVVYVSGAFDLFHIGHLKFLQKARSLGDYLIVGVHTDQEVNAFRGGNEPVMRLEERVLCTLAYKPVNAVVSGAPKRVTEALIAQHRINVVVVPAGVAQDDADYEIARDLKILHRLEPSSDDDLTPERVIDRIVENRRVYLARNAAKQVKETTFHATKIH